VPATFLVSAEGMMVERYQGLVSNETLSRKLETLLAARARGPRGLRQEPR
jgi:hypothetical protein